MSSADAPGSHRALAPADVTHDDLVALIRAGRLADECGPLVRLTQDSPILPGDLGAEPCVVLGVDVVPSSDAEHDEIIATVCRGPIASSALAVLLRAHDSSIDKDHRIAYESAVYSALQSGPEFRRWRASRPEKPLVPEDDVVTVETRDTTLRVTLNRPQHGNAVNRGLRDAWCEALSIAFYDDAIARVELRGNGHHFCTGGDLDEFGTFGDAASAHLVRLERSPARLLARLGESTTAYLHGRCAGSGVELAAFASHVSAMPDTSFELPELSLGLVPGAGGTVSICDRIGTQRTAWMLYTGRRVTATTAMEWGLIDAVDQ